MSASPYEPVACERYARNARGEVVHRLDCKRRGRTSVEWTYAEGMPVEWVMGEIARIPWLKACSTCLPSNEQSECPESSGQPAQKADS